MRRFVHYAIVTGTFCVLLATLVGCQRQRDIEEPEARGRIQFQSFVHEGLRAGEETITTLAGAGFNVRAYGQGALYFADRVSATNTDGSGFWNTAGTHVWPGYELDFIAHNGLGSYGTADFDADKSITLTTPEQVEDQVDIIVARKKGNWAEHATNGVPLHFKHLLAQLSVQAKNGNSAYKVEVAGVKVGRAKSEVTFTLPTEITQADELTSYGTPSVPNSFGASTATVLTLTDTPQLIGQSAKGNFMLIPQEITAWDQATHLQSNTDNSGTYLGVLVRITTPSGAQYYPLEAGKYAYATVPFAVAGGLKPGVHYAVTLDFSEGAGFQEPELGKGNPSDLPTGVEISPSPWGGQEQPGAPILGGAIKFDITVEPWQGKSIDIQMGADERRAVSMQYGSRKLTFSIPKDATELKESDLPQVDMPGRKLLHWEDGKGNQITFPYTLTEDFVLTAKLESYYATLKLPQNYQFKDGATADKRLELEEEGTLPEIPELQPQTNWVGNPQDKRGFVGWSKEQNPTISSEVVASETVLTEDVTLYAILTEGVVSQTTGSELFYVAGTGETARHPKFFTFASDVQTRSLRAGKEGIEIGKLYVAKFPVTQSEYKQVMGSNPSFFSSPDQSRFAGNEFQGFLRENADHRPVESVTWMDAIRFCNALSHKDGLTPAYTISGDTPEGVTRDFQAKGYRLPTEAEWIWVATAVSGRNNHAVASNNGAAIVANFAWLRSNAHQWTGSGFAWETFSNPGYGTQPVGGKRPNEVGIYDMSGNVWEWVEDWYGTRTYERANGPARGTYKVLKGGSYHSEAKYLNVDYRKKHLPDRTNKLIGFRIVRNIK